MKVVQDPPEMEPAVELECSKGHRFWVDPCGEENLEFSPPHRSLKAVCPVCGEREADEEEGLKEVMERITYDDKHLKLWKDLKKNEN